MISNILNEQQLKKKNNFLQERKKQDCSLSWCV